MSPPHPALTLPDECPCVYCSPSASLVLAEGLTIALERTVHARDHPGEVTPSTEEFVSCFGHLRGSFDEGGVIDPEDAEMGSLNEPAEATSFAESQFAKLSRVKHRLGQAVVHGN